MKKKYNIILSICMLAVLGWACSSDSDSSEEASYDPSKPVRIHDFLPDSGSIRTKFVIEGENFGNDPSKVKVRFNNQEALVLGLTNHAIYTIVPKNPGDSCIISVIVENDSVAYDNKKFAYRITASVSTVVGKAKETGTTDGTINEATFQAPRWCAIDYEDNLIVADPTNRRVRLVSINSDKVITLLTPSVSPQNFAMTKDRKVFYEMIDNGTAIYKYDSDQLWVPQMVANTGISGYFHNITFGPESESERYLYSRRNLGIIYRIDLQNPYTTAVQYSGDYSETGGQGNIVFSHVENCFYIVTKNKNSVYRMSADGTEYTKYTGGGSDVGTSGGYQDGPIAQALYKGPRGIAINSEGDIYIADEENHCIRKIDYRTKLVTTVAGIPGTAGYEDGEPDKALFSAPCGLTFDKEDFLYIADEGNHCIRKLAIE